MVCVVERLFKPIAVLAFAGGLLFAGLFAYECDWRDVSISLGVSVLGFTYWIATYTRDDLTRSG